MLKHAFVGFIFIFSNLNILQTKVLYSLVGGITNNSVKINAKSEGNSVNIYLNGTIQKVTNLIADGNKEYYSFQIDGLTSNTVYELMLQEQNDFTEKRYFKTFQEIADPAVFSFIVSSYSKLQSSQFVYNNIITENPNFVMILGDIHNEGLSSNSESPFLEAYTTCIYIL